MRNSNSLNKSTRVRFVMISLLLIPALFAISACNGSSSSSNQNADGITAPYITGITVDMDTIHCTEAGDGPGNAEPYLWTYYFKVDGTNTSSYLGNVSDPNGNTTLGLRFRGHVTSWASTGSHGDLGTTDVGDNQDVPIPANIGEKSNINLLPIAAPNGLQSTVRSTIGTDNIPGYLGVVTVLLEEDNVPDDAAEAGHTAFNAAMSQQLNDFINNKLSNKHASPSPQDVTDISNQVQKATTDAITSSLNVFQKLWSGVNPDDLEILSQKLYSSIELADAPPINGTHDGEWGYFADSQGADGEWSIHGEIKVDFGNMLPQQLRLSVNPSNSEAFSAPIFHPAVWAWDRDDFDTIEPIIESLGYKLISLEAYLDISGQELYDVVWQYSQSSRPAVWGWSRSDFDQKQSSMYTQGYQLTYLYTYLISPGQPRYNAIWEPISGPYSAIWAATENDFSTRLNNLGQNYPITSLNTYLENGQDYYDAVWGPTNSTQLASWDMNQSILKIQVALQATQGYQLASLSPFLSPDGQTLYDAIFQKTQEVHTSEWAVSQADFEEKANSMAVQGQEIISLNTIVGSNGQELYCAVWAPEQL